MRQGFERASGERPEAERRHRHLAVSTVMVERDHRTDPEAETQGDEQDRRRAGRERARASGGVASGVRHPVTVPAGSDGSRPPGAVSKRPIAIAHAG